jgi:hypothetical protein
MAEAESSLLYRPHQGMVPPLLLHHFPLFLLLLLI